MQAFKQVLIKEERRCKEETVNLSFIHICILYFYSKLNKYVFCLFLDKKRYYMPDDYFCMKLRTAWIFYLMDFQYISMFFTLSI